MLTTVSYIGLGILFVGVILTIVGVVYYELQLTANKPITWWVWLSLSLGGVMVITGLVVTIIFLKHPAATPESKSIIVNA